MIPVSRNHLKMSTGQIEAISSHMVFDSERRQGKLISTVAIDKHMIFRAAGFNAIEIDPISNFRVDGL